MLYPSWRLSSSYVNTDKGCDTPTTLVQVVFHRLRTEITIRVFHSFLRISHQVLTKLCADMLHVLFSGMYSGCASESVADPLSQGFGFLTSVFRSAGTVNIENRVPFGTLFSCRGTIHVPPAGIEPATYASEGVALSTEPRGPNTPDENNDVGISPPSAIEKRVSTLSSGIETATSKIILPTAEPRHRHQRRWQSFYFSAN